MNGEMGCDQVTELAPEIALGIAGGEERDGALRHLAACSACRELVSHMSSVSDELLLLAPLAEPPMGFEARVLDRLTERERARRPTWWRTALLAAAAAVLAATIAVGSVLHATSGDRRLAASYRDLLSRAGGSFFAVAMLQGQHGTGGTAFGYEGRPSWIFVTLASASAVERHYRVELLTSGGRYVDLGDAVLGGGQGTWGRAIPVDLASVRSVQFRGNDGTTVLEARFSPQSPWPPPG